MQFGKAVKALHRSKIENIDLKNLKIGEWRFLTKKEIEFIEKSIVKLDI